MPRALKPVDPRHAEIRAVLVKYWATELPTGPELPWGPADAGALGTFLRSNPTLTVEQITELLRNRLKSDEHARGEPVFVWIKYLTRYLSGPLDKYKQPKVTPDAKPSRADESRTHAASATSAAVDRIRGLAGRADRLPGVLPPPKRPA